MIRIVLLSVFCILWLYNIFLWFNQMSSYSSMVSDTEKTLEYYDNAKEMELLKKLNFTYFSTVNDLMIDFVIYDRKSTYTKTKVDYTTLSEEFLWLEKVVKKTTTKKPTAAEEKTEESSEETDKTKENKTDELE